jgi:formylglycine-generating enzyme required for sulfatase activity
LINEALYNGDDFMHSPVTDILPSPFEWIEIPEGTVTLVPTTNVDKEKSYLKQDTVFTVPAFAIAKYPVTNAQFAKFIEAGGYREEKWWMSTPSWMVHKKVWTEPRYWGNALFNGPEQPVVGVSWYESTSFCTWLSALTGENISLPTEQQWQRAAQGDDGRLYPWGNEEPNDQLCNWKNSNGRTTPVTHYPLGASPFGVMDMAGNVWEWCLTDYMSGGLVHDGRGLPLIRGGAFFVSFSSHLRVVHRDSEYPDSRASVLGFRLVRLS